MDILDNEQLKQVTKQVTKELVKRKLIIQADRWEMEKVRNRLREYYRENKQDAGVKRALEELKNDNYYPVLQMQYGEGKTNEQVAEEINRSVRSLNRNKKRILSLIYLMLYE